MKLFQKLRFFLIIWVAISFGSQIAVAHKVVADVYVSGSIIEGEIGFSNGDPAKNVVVEIFDSSDSPLGQTETDEEGFFIYHPTKIDDLTFKANMGAGHVAIIELSKGDMTGLTLAEKSLDENAVNIKDEKISSQTGLQNLKERGRQENSASHVDTVYIQNLENSMQKEFGKLQQEIKNLRREIKTAREEKDYQSILGGIGFIFGLSGVYMFALSRREQRNKDKEKAHETR